MDRELRKELLEMHTLDEETLKRLASAGDLGDSYHPLMQAVHRKNAARLAEIMDQTGWPVRSLAGEAGMRAAWWIAQNAIAEPDFQRRAFALLQDAVARGEAPAWQAAMLADRIRTLEGRLQVYGTQFDWDDDGRMSPLPIEDVEHVNERRHAMGLMPLEEEIRRRKASTGESVQQPQDPVARRRRMEEWARSVGWRR